jgi:hypothetical protein
MIPMDRVTIRGKIVPARLGTVLKDHRAVEENLKAVATTANERCAIAIDRNPATAASGWDGVETNDSAAKAVRIEVARGWDAGLPISAADRCRAAGGSGWLSAVDDLVSIGPSVVRGDLAMANEGWRSAASAEDRTAFVRKARWEAVGFGRRSRADHAASDLVPTAIGPWRRATAIDIGIPVRPSASAATFAHQWVRDSVAEDRCRMRGRKATRFIPDLAAVLVLQDSSADRVVDSDQDRSSAALIAAVRSRWLVPTSEDSIAARAMR